MFRRIVLLSAIFAVAIFGNWNDTQTGIDLNRLPHFPLMKIRSGLLKRGSLAMIDSISATEASGDKREVVLRGAGKSGKRWEAHIFGLDEVWRGDLDGNGMQDYIFFSVGPYGNGRTAPPFSLSILLMDRGGMPVPFFTVVYKGENGDGIKHLLDLNHDGHAELLISTYDEKTSDPRVGTFCSGHWVNQLYQFKDLGVEEVRGSVGGITFPLIHEWSDRGKCVELEKPFLTIQPPTFYEHGTGKQGGAITSIGKVDSMSGLLSVNPVNGCSSVRASVIVYDRPQLREIAFPNPFDDYSNDLADRIRSDGANVELRGVDRWMSNGACSVNLMWAQ